MKKIFAAALLGPGSLVLLMLLTATLLTACVPTTPNWDSQFGDAARLSVAQQTLNPDAGSAQVSESVDGNASREAMGRYRSSFKEPQPNTSSFTIGVGR